MYLKNISILNFKNLKEFEEDFSPRFNCFLGRNGVGKTNIMDAIYYMSFTKSHFNSIDRQNITYEEDMFVIQGNYKLKEQETKMLCGLKRNSRKQIKRDNKEYDKLSDHIGLLPLVFITPSDTEIIKLGSDLRRKYIDGVISQYDKKYLASLLRYNKALEQRNALLKNLNLDNAYDEDALIIWDEQLNETGTYIHQKRSEAIDQLIPVFNDYYNSISNNNEKVSLNYRSKLFETDLSTLLRQSRKKDILLKHTTTGIHRDDLEFELNSHPMKRTASQGQEKTLIVSLKLAQFDFIKTTTQVRPILLLDDIFDKLDSDRISKLVELLSDSKYGQVFFSDTSKTRLPDLLKGMNVDVKIFNIEN